MNSFEKNVNLNIKFRNIISSIKKNKILSIQKSMPLVDLKIYGRSKLKDMAKRTKVSKQALCIMCNNLLNQKLIVKEIDKNDKRNVLYSINENGLKLLNKDMKNIEKCALEILSRKLNENEITEFFNYLDKLNALLEKSLED